MILADNGSTDGTRAEATSIAAELGVSLRVISEVTPGKSNALNTALLYVDTPYVVTVDADTLLHTKSLRRLVSRLESAPPDTAAVAGTVLVRNSRVNLLTRMREWDYYLGIAAVKRMQALYQATLVAQGAFSLYRTDEVRAVGGWPDVFGPMDLQVRRNRFGYVAFLLGYQVLCSTASLAGYAQHVAGTRRRWK